MQMFFCEWLRKSKVAFAVLDKRQGSSWHKRFEEITLARPDIDIGYMNRGLIQEKERL